MYSQRPVFTSMVKPLWPGTSKAVPTALSCTAVEYTGIRKEF